MVQRIDPATDEVADSFPMNARPINGILFDGSSIWVTTWGPAELVQLQPSDGAKLNSVALGNDALAMAFDGTYIWVTHLATDNSTGLVTKVRASDGERIASYPVGASGVVFDGTNVWVGNGADMTITRLRASDGQLVDTFRVDGRPSAMVFDGDTVWVGYSKLDGSLSRAATSLQRFPISDVTAFSNVSSGTVWDLHFDGTHVWRSGNGNMIVKYRISDGQNVGQFASDGGDNVMGVLYAVGHLWVSNLIGPGSRNDVVTRHWVGPP